MQKKKSRYLYVGGSYCQPVWLESRGMGISVLYGNCIQKTKKRTYPPVIQHSYEKSPFSIGKLTISISMAIFNSYVDIRGYSIFHFLHTRYFNLDWGPGGESAETDSLRGETGQLLGPLAQQNYHPARESSKSTHRRKVCFSKNPVDHWKIKKWNPSVSTSCQPWPVQVFDHRSV